jgi:hypothetical protein
MRGPHTVRGGCRGQKAPVYFNAVIASRAKQSRRDCRVALRAPRNDKPFQHMQRIHDAGHWGSVP